MERIYWLVLLMSWPFWVGGQTAENLVPNPGFEAIDLPPVGWFYEGAHFTDVLEAWSSPTAASPDAYGPLVEVPQSWAEKGFGDQSPKGGNSIVGLTLFGCQDGKPHCREYIQVKLREPLRAGSTYRLSFWLARLPRSLAIDRIGALFATQPIRLSSDVPIERQPQMTVDRVVIANDWTAIERTFEADAPYEYLLLGNFAGDSLTQSQAVEDDPFPFAYYYFDELELLELAQPKVSTEDLSKLKIERGKIVRLRNIFFETDKDRLLPDSYEELNKLVRMLNRYPNMTIQINGHTDSRGADAYNLDLSIRRARAVVNYLRNQGVDPDRLQYQGYGSRQPIAPNDTKQGRQKNRRVEFVILVTGDLD